jgi:P-type Ca2+ transporter type 2C
MIATPVHEGGDLPPRISARHCAVAGRARLQIAGLRGNEGLSRILTALEPEAGIHRISANAITGNILVLYDPEHDLTEIVGYLEMVIQQPPVPSEDPKPAEAPRSSGVFGFLRDLFLRPARNHAPELTPSAPRRNLAGRPPEALPQPWHSVEAAHASAFWRTSPSRGLAATEAMRRLEVYGANVLDPPQARSALAVLGEQFLSLPVLLLMGSAALSIATGGIADAIVISAVVAMNAGIGFATEYNAERAIMSLLDLSEPHARVIREGAVQMVSGDAVVPGDLLVFKRGESIVADARLIASNGLTLDEAALTGESLPAEKLPDPLSNAALALAERSNMVYRGTTVTGGQGVALVIATGRHTEIGRIQALLAESIQPETPLQRQMRELGSHLTWLICGASAAMFGLGLLRGFAPVEMLRSAVSLAIAAVPEGLPTIATVCLAGGMRSLMQQKVMARRLAAVETLGAIQVLCFDKTGTLTKNLMTAVAVHAGMRDYSVSQAAFIANGRPVAPGSRPELSKLLEVCGLCSEATAELRDDDWIVEGSPTEAALVRMALNSGLDVADLRTRYALLGIRHRTESEPYMATTHHLPNGRQMIAVKGSPTDVLRLCEWHADDGKVQRLGHAERAEVMAANARMARGGLRVLGAACQEHAPDAAPSGGLVWLGLVGLADPPRHGLKEVVAELHRAGVRPLMLTGDQAATAEAIAGALAMNGGGAVVAVQAPEFEAANPKTAASFVRNATVFSRVTPSHKLQIVQALQKEGAVVGMTGDGVNDAPALKAADVGIALGQSGTKVARGVADLLLADDDIASLVPAIREGRRVYEDLRKAVHYIAATNASEVMMMFGSLAAGLGQPLNPRQLLWINLLTDVLPELALAVEPLDPSAMSRPPRDPAQPVIGPPEYARLGLQAATMTGAAMGAYLYGLARGGGAHANTMAFLSLTSAQLLHGLTARSDHRGPLPPNLAMRNGLLAGFGLLLASQLFPGLTSLLGTTRVGVVDAFVCAGAALASFVANEAMKPPDHSTNSPDSSSNASSEVTANANTQWIH